MKNLITVYRITVHEKKLSRGPWSYKNKYKGQNYENKERPEGWSVTQGSGVKMWIARAFLELSHYNKLWVHQLRIKPEGILAVEPYELIIDPDSIVEKKLVWVIPRKDWEKQSRYYYDREHFLEFIKNKENGKARPKPYRSIDLEKRRLVCKAFPELDVWDAVKLADRDVCYAREIGASIILEFKTGERIRKEVSR